MTDQTTPPTTGPATEAAPGCGCDDYVRASSGVSRRGVLAGASGLGSLAASGVFASSA
jgi:hypothetical protein